jgi:hypothetical protein
MGVASGTCGSDRYARYSVHDELALTAVFGVPAIVIAIWAVVRLAYGRSRRPR